MSFLSPDTTLLHYRIVERIGRGGMGEVYRSWDTKLARNVLSSSCLPKPYNPCRYQN